MYCERARKLCHVMKNRLFHSQRSSLFRQEKSSSGWFCTHSTLSLTSSHISVPLSGRASVGRKLKAPKSSIRDTLLGNVLRASLLGKLNERELMSVQISIRIGLDVWKNKKNRTHFAIRMHTIGSGCVWAAKRCSVGRVKKCVEIKGSQYYGRELKRYKMIGWWRAPKLNIHRERTASSPFTHFNFLASSLLALQHSLLHFFGDGSGSLCLLFDRPSRSTLFFLFCALCFSPATNVFTLRPRSLSC